MYIRYFFRLHSISSSPSVSSPIFVQCQHQKILSLCPCLSICFHACSLAGYSGFVLAVWAAAPDPPASALLPPSTDRGAAVSTRCFVLMSTVEWQAWKGDSSTDMNYLSAENRDASDWVPKEQKIAMWQWYVSWSSVFFHCNLGHRFPTVLWLNLQLHAKQNLWYRKSVRLISVHRLSLKLKSSCNFQITMETCLFWSFICACLRWYI